MGMVQLFAWYDDIAPQRHRNGGRNSAPTQSSISAVAKEGRAAGRVLLPSELHRSGAWFGYKWNKGHAPQPR